MAKQFCRWDPELKIIGLRFSNIMEPEDYARFAGFPDDARQRKWNLWAYIDARDAAQAVRLALEAKIKGAEVFIIANADGVMHRDNQGLLKEAFPDVPHKRSFGPNETLLAIDKARAVLGYKPSHSWRDYAKLSCTSEANVLSKLSAPASGQNSGFLLGERTRIVRAFRQQSQR